MLDKLKELLRINGKLSGLIIDEAADCPSSSMFRSRFGSLLKSYQEVGYTPSRDYRYLKINRALRRTHADLVEQTIAEIERLGGAVSRIPENDLLHINQEFFCFSSAGTLSDNRCWYQTLVYTFLTVALLLI